MSVSPCAQIFSCTIVTYMSTPCSCSSSVLQTSRQNGNIRLEWWDKMKSNFGERLRRKHSQSGETVITLACLFQCSSSWLESSKPSARGRPSEMRANSVNFTMLGFLPLFPRLSASQSNLTKVSLISMSDMEAYQAIQVEMYLCKQCSCGLSRRVAQRSRLLAGSESHFARHVKSSIDGCCSWIVCSVSSTDSL